MYINDGDLIEDDWKNDKFEGKRMVYYNDGVLY